MKQLMLAAGVVVLIGAAANAETHDAVVITTAGEYPFIANDTYGAVTNKASDGEVKLTSTGGTVVGDAVGLASFDATVAGAQTVFSGGYWDFGATGSDTANFFSEGQTLADRRTAVDNGAQLVGIGSLYLAGTGANNAFTLSGASSLSAYRVVLGSGTSANQKSVLTVEDGASLICADYLCLSMATVSSAAQAKTQLGNRLTVTGQGSSITVGGTLSVGGQHPTQANSWGTRGGNAFEVTDGATAQLAAVTLGTGSRHSTSNALVFGKNSTVSMSSLAVSSSSSKATDYPVAGNSIEIVDGASVSVSGAFTFGYSDLTYRGGNHCLVSNATFSVGKVFVANSVGYFLCGPNSTFTLSGSDAEFGVTEGIKAFFKGSGCSFVVENGATYDYTLSSYSHTIHTDNERIVARKNATLNFPNSIKMSKASGDMTGSITNGLIAASGATITCAGQLSVYGTGSYLEVDDATVKTTGSGKLVIAQDGSLATVTGTNCLLHVIGTCPQIDASASIHISNDSRMRVDLPAGGYATGYATSERPIILSSGKVLFNGSSTLELDGAEEMMAYHTANKIKASYVLAKADEITLSEDKISAVQATLPDGMTISVRANKTKEELVLDVRPKFGLVLFVR